MHRLIVVVLAVAVPTGCSFLPRDTACVKAEACDNALEEPFGSFDADDPQFGDQGTCWLSAENAKPCIATCQAFIDEQRQTVDADDDGIADVATNQIIVDACK